MIQRQSTFLTVIVAISLILRNKTIKPWKPLQSELLNFESMIKKLIVANHAFFTSITFSGINSLTYINSTVIQHL